MPIGSLMLDLTGIQITDEERELLAHPQTGGIILFTRNFESVAQLDELVGEIRSIRPEIIIAVDHEGGRVQRFREGFSKIPAMRKLGENYLNAPEQTIQAASQIGWLLAAELLVHDIDLSFAPVLDLDHGLSQVIGDRAFADAPQITIELAGAFIDGMHEAGMIATGKHFPGHGGVTGDSHTDIPVDDRSLEQLEATDLIPFKALAGQLDALMPAHVVYSSVDQKPAGFSKTWIQQILREQMGFDGVVFSDDLSMEGATLAGSYAQRAKAALVAGCDMVLVCNDRPGALEVLDFLQDHQVAPSERLSRLKHRSKVASDLASSPEWQAAQRAIQSIA